MRDAIRLNDHIRIRNGSPGSNERRNLLTIESKKSFEEEMQDKGLISEIEDLNRFNYVLVTRSSPNNVDQEKFISELAGRMYQSSSDCKSREQALTGTNEKLTAKKDHLMVTPY